MVCWNFSGESWASRKNFLSKSDCVRECSPGHPARASSRTTAASTAGSEICRSICLLASAYVEILLLDPVAYGARSHSSHKGSRVYRWMPNCWCWGEGKRGMSYPARWLMFRTIGHDTPGQSLSDIATQHFFLLVQQQQRRLLNRTWRTHFTRLSLSGAHHFVFSLKDNTSPIEAKRNLFPSKEVSGDAVSLA